MLLNVRVLPGHALDQIKGLVELTTTGANRNEDVVHLVGRRDALLQRLLIKTERARDVSLLLAGDEQAAVGDVCQGHIGPPHLIGQVERQGQRLVIAVTN